jgi:hypothetical protein
MARRSGPPCGATTRSSLRPSARCRSSSCPDSCLRWPSRDIASAVPELDIRGILAELTSEGVEFLVIGGVAVGFHGYVRATKDVDIVPAVDPENLEKLARVLRGLEAQIEGAEEFKDEELPDPLDPEVLGLGGNWVLRTRLGRFDVMQWIGEDALWERLAPAAIEAEIDGLPIKVVSYEDLVKLKEMAGRPDRSAASSPSTRRGVATAPARSALVAQRRHHRLDRCSRGRCAASKILHEHPIDHRGLRSNHPRLPL